MAQAGGSGLRLGFGLLAMLVTLSAASAARASGDFGCRMSLKLAHHGFTGCDNGAALSPANDTRVNLVLLLQDRRPAPADSKPGTPDVFTEWGAFAARTDPVSGPAGTLYAEGEGSRCRSDEAGAKAFEAALAAAGGVPPAERDRLIAARRGLKPTCMGPGVHAPGVQAAVAAVRSPAGQAFARYLQGADAFYDGRFDEAAAAFAASRVAASPWLADTAAYMQARVEVNRMQEGAFDEYGAFAGAEKVNAAAVARAEAALSAYLRERPRGAYADSARGLVRRVHWFSGRTDRLQRDYAALMAQPPAGRGLTDSDLAQEIDNKLLPQLKPGAVEDPWLLAVVDLQHMRTPDTPADKDCCADTPTLAALEAQRPVFARDPALFELLLATHAFYVRRAPAEVLRLIPDGTRGRDRGAVWFGRQMLRGQALEAVGDRNARGFWLTLLPLANRPMERPLVELALALHDERERAVARLFEPASPVRNPLVRRLALMHAADPALLRRQASDRAVLTAEREAAAFTLVYKDATRGRYGDVGTDLPLAPAPVAPPAETEFAGWDGEGPPPLALLRKPVGGPLNCPRLPDTAAALAADPRRAVPRLCLAEWVRVNGLDGFVLDTPPPKDELGGAPSLFPGPAFSRAAVYREVMADRTAPADAKAYALYRAVNCYAPSGNNQCGGEAVDKAQRKAWFTRLKSEFPRSRWADELQYWW